MASNIKCTKCEKSFARKKDQEKHFNANHLCILCKFVAEDKDELKVHKKKCEMHTLLHHRCFHCGKLNSHKGHHEKHELSCGISKKKIIKLG